MRKDAAETTVVSRDDVLNYCSENRVALSAGAVSGAGSFHEWLAEIGKGSGVAVLKGLDLRGADLSHGDFSGVLLDGTTLEGAVLEHTSFEKASLPKTCFINATIRDASFAGADLTGSRFDGAKILGSGPLARGDQRKNVDFTAANLREVHFDRAHIRNTLFTHAELVDASLAESQLENVRFNGANMIGVTAEGAQPQFREAKGIRSHPVGIEMAGAILIGTRNMEAFDGHTGDALTTLKHLEGAISRAVAVCHAGVPTIPHVRDQVIVRREAGAEMQRRFPQQSKESGITAVWQELAEMMPPLQERGQGWEDVSGVPAQGFAVRIRQEQMRQPPQGRG